MTHMKLIDWTSLYEKYKGLWVALSEDDNETVVGSGATAKEALDQAQGKGFINAAITFVPTEMVTFARYLSSTEYPMQSPP
jgi:hypothetical protein